jgi:hypothetical protein
LESEVPTENIGSSGAIQNGDTPAYSFAITAGFDMAYRYKRFAPFQRRHGMKADQGATFSFTLA